MAHDLRAGFWRMSESILEIDHLITFVDDYASAAADYRAMGFTLTPPSHISAMGIVNQMVLLKARTVDAANFIELMGIAEPALLPPSMRILLSGSPGVKSMVMVTRDAAEAQKQLAAAGYPFDPPQRVRREWELPGEASVWPEFDVLLPIPAPFAFNLCQYHNIDLYQRESWQDHPNTAQTLMACFGVAAAPSDGIEYFETLFGRPALETGDGGMAISPAQTQIIFYSHDRFAQALGVVADPARSQAYAGFRIGVADIGALRACLDESAISYTDSETRIIVGPSFACGNVIEFVTMKP